MEAATETMARLFEEAAKQRDEARATCAELRNDYDILHRRLVAEHDRAEGLQREVAKLQDLAEAHKKAIGLLLNKAAEAQLDAAKLRAKLERREEEEKPPQESPHEFVVRVRTFGAELLITQGVVSSGHAIQLLSDALGMLISMHGTPVPEGEE